MKYVVTFAAALAAALSAHQSAHAHGFAGKRFFPATIATDDPFVADELSLPTVSSVPDSTSGGEPSTRETDVGVDIAKRITPNFGIEVGETWKHFDPKGGRSFSGFDNLGVGAKYLLLERDSSEFLFSVGLDADVGGTGSQKIGADRFSTLTPGIFFGKGFGDLPDSAALFKPFAVTGVLGVDFPTESQSAGDGGDMERHPHVLNVGLAFEYSLPYLQSNVRDIGLGAPFNRMIPLVEVNIQSPLDRGSAGKTTATIGPGLIWSGQFMQIGLEAIVPVNERSGDGVGVVGQLHFYLDDIFPASLGRPVFGGGP
jgi:hypothetical protein